MPYTVYVGGPMTNRPNFNFPAFDSLSAYLRDRGWDVHNPHEHDLELYPTIDDAEATKTGDVIALNKEIGFTLGGAMRWDLVKVAESDGIVLLPEWETSSGATYERYVAECCGREVWLATFSEQLGWVIALDPQQVRVPKGSLVSMLGDAPPAEPVTQWAAMLETISDDVARTGEVRVIDPSTGGAKGAKAQAMHLVPGDALLAISEHLDRGAQKYAERNWELGYAWSLSFAAMQRHLWAWWQGEDNDPEFGWSHLRAVGFHALVLLAFELRGAGTDDRPAV